MVDFYLPLPPSLPHDPLPLAAPALNTLTMSAQHLNELDASSTQFPEQLDKLLCDKEWIDQLKTLPKGELVELTGHLNGV